MCVICIFIEEIDHHHFGYAGSEADDSGPCRALELSSSVTTLLFEVVEPATKKSCGFRGWFSVTSKEKTCRAYKFEDLRTTRSLVS